MVDTGGLGKRIEPWDGLELVKALKCHFCFIKVPFFKKENNKYREDQNLAMRYFVFAIIFMFLAGCYYEPPVPDKEVPITSIKKSTLSHYLDKDAKTINNSDDWQKIGRASCRERVYVLV